MDPYADLQEKLRRKEELIREREEKVSVVVMVVEDKEEVVVVMVVTRGASGTITMFSRSIQVTTSPHRS